jgi:hypothetical protein
MALVHKPAADTAQRPKHKWEGNITTDPTGIRWDWFHLTQKHVASSCEHGMKLWVP